MTVEESKAQLARLRTGAVSPPIPPVPKISQFLENGILKDSGARQYDLAMEEWRKKSVAILQSANI